MHHHHHRTHSSNSVSASSYPGLLIPLYKDPKVTSNACSEPDYLRIASSAVSKKTIVILNPNNGPGSKKDSKYTTCIAHLRSKGVKVVGYVHTKEGYPDISGYRDYEKVKSDVDTWFNYYTIDGIFVDEVSNQWADEESYDSEDTVYQYYGKLSKYIQSKSSNNLVILNPGSPYFNKLTYSRSSNIMAVVFEESMKNWNSPSSGQCKKSSSGIRFTAGPWCAYKPSDDGVEQVKNKIDNNDIKTQQSAVLVYSVDSSKISTIVKEAKSQNIGYVYLTSYGTDSAWTKLVDQSFWNTMVSALSS